MRTEKQIQKRYDDAIVCRCPLCLDILLILEWILDIQKGDCE